MPDPKTLLEQLLTKLDNEQENSKQTLTIKVYHDERPEKEEDKTGEQKQ